MAKKEVFFDQYCPKCEFFKLKQSEEPCNECLTAFSNEDSHKPVKFKEKAKKK